MCVKQQRKSFYFFSAKEGWRVWQATFPGSIGLSGTLDTPSLFFHWGLPPHFTLHTIHQPSEHQLTHTHIHNKNPRIALHSFTITASLCHCSCSAHNPHFRPTLPYIMDYLHFYVLSPALFPHSMCVVSLFLISVCILSLLFPLIHIISYQHSFLSLIYPHTQIFPRKKYASWIESNRRRE